MLILISLAKRVVVMWMGSTAHSLVELLSFFFFFFPFPVVIWGYLGHDCWSCLQTWAVIQRWWRMQLTCTFRSCKVGTCRTANQVCRLSFNNASLNACWTSLIWNSALLRKESIFVGSVLDASHRHLLDPLCKFQCPFALWVALVVLSSCFYLHYASCWKRKCHFLHCELLLKYKLNLRFS